MCGRYQFTAEQSAEIRRIAQEIQRKYGDHAWTPGEIRPTATAPVLLPGHSGVRPELHHWGYHLPDSLVINARAETAEEKPLFRDSMANGRCVVPSTGFYEWDSEKRKFLFTLPGSEALYMAGLWSVRDGLPCFCILTTEANGSMREVHPRMPWSWTERRSGPGWRTCQRREACSGRRRRCWRRRRRTNSFDCGNSGAYTAHIRRRYKRT